MSTHDGRAIGGAALAKPASGMRSQPLRIRSANMTSRSP